MDRISHKPEERLSVLQTATRAFCPVIGVLLGAWVVWASPDAAADCICLFRGYARCVGSGWVRAGFGRAFSQWIFPLNLFFGFCERECTGDVHETAPWLGTGRAFPTFVLVGKWIRAQQYDSETNICCYFWLTPH